MENGFDTELLTLIDDDGNNHEFEVLDEIEIDEGHFMALKPTAQNTQNGLIDAETGTYYIFEVVDVDGEEELSEVEDDDLADKLDGIFESRFEDEFYGEDESEGDEEQ